MINVTTSQLTEEWLKIYAQPEPSQYDELNVRAKGTISSLFGEQNEIWLGRPHAFDLRSLPITDGSPEEAYARQLLQSSDLILVQFACSFRSAPECNFVRATVTIAMRNAFEHARCPIAYDMFPIEVMMPVTFKRTLSISPNVKLDFAKVAQAEVSAFKVENASEYIVYQPEIVAFGKGESTAGWDFNKSSSRSILGVKDLFVLVEKPRLVPAQLYLSVSNCEVQTTIGRIPLPSLFMTGGKGPFAQESLTIR